MNAMLTRSLCGGLLLTGVVTLPAAASTIELSLPSEVSVLVEITEFSGTGSGSVPLVRDLDNSLPGSVDGWGFADATATIGESPLLESSLIASIIFDSDTLEISVNTTATLFLDLVLEEVAGGGAFFTGSPLSLAASAANPLLIETSALVDLGVVDLDDPHLLQALIDAIDPTTITTTVTDAKYLLGVDINGSGGNDVLTLATSDLDTSSLAFDVDDGDFDALIEAILNGTASSPLAIGANVGISGLALTFSGAVFDAASDPPFTLDFPSLDVTGTDPLASTAVPEPAGLALLALGGLLLVCWRRGTAAGTL